MRSVFLALLFANLVLLAWGQGYFGGQEAGRESERLARQIEAEKLRILPAPPADAAPPAPAVEAMACKRIDGLATADAAELQPLLAGLPGWLAELKTRKEIVQYRVMIPELANAAAAQKKQGELRKLGAEEGTVVEEGAAFALLLKTFAAQKAADDYLQVIGRKGVRSARVLPREGNEKSFIEVRAPAGELARKLPELLAPLPAHSLADCPP